MSETGAMQIRPFHSSDTEAVITLWHEVGLTRPWNDPAKDIERKSTTQPELFLVAEQGDDVVGTAMVGYDGHRGWAHYLAVSSSLQGTGLGRDLMAEAERLLIALDCPKINLMVRTGNDRVIGFYEALGYATDEVALLSKRLIPDA
ncbi:MAG TPA: GNAT family acetyltransferase [Plantibacter sp.]|uniref:GNAT family acetyltransferase n=1 Tax=unclassified Plantibacter TaxID=2624265 RepID=UPI002C25111C|nr:GNAT family acetyltransferase [Plantibacter sp.]